MRPADMRTENERGGLKKLIAKTTFPANFKEKVDMSKVNMETMVPWIQAEVEKYVGFDDEVLVGYVQSQLAPPDGSPVDPRAVQINLMGFLEKNTSTFMKELCALALAPTLARSLARSLAPTLTSGQPSALTRSLRLPRFAAAPLPLRPGRAQLPGEGAPPAARHGAAHAQAAQPRRRHGGHAPLLQAPRGAAATQAAARLRAGGEARAAAHSLRRPSFTHVTTSRRVAPGINKARRTRAHVRP